MWAITLEQPGQTVNQVRYSWPMVPIDGGVGGIEPSRFGMMLTYHDLLASSRMQSHVPFFLELSYCQAHRQGGSLAPTKEYVFWYCMLLFPWSSHVSRSDRRFAVGDFPLRGAPACSFVSYFDYRSSEVGLFLRCFYECFFNCATDETV